MIFPGANDENYLKNNKVKILNLNNKVLLKNKCLPCISRTPVIPSISSPKVYLLKIMRRWIAATR